MLTCLRPMTNLLLAAAFNGSFSLSREREETEREGLGIGIRGCRWGG
jgi:hypothetical protein